MPADLRVRLAGRARDLGFSLGAEEVDALATYLELLSRWNRTINLTALPLEGFPDRTLDRLVFEPIAAARLTGAAPGKKLQWFDLGTGGGSPAIPMAIVLPHASLTMVEARERKAAFLREAVRHLDLRASVMCSRFETLGDRDADLATARAVRIDADFVVAVQRLLRPGGRLLLFGVSSVDLPGFAPLLHEPLPSVVDRLSAFERST